MAIYRVYAPDGTALSTHASFALAEAEIELLIGDVVGTEEEDDNRGGWRSWEVFPESPYDTSPAPDDSVIYRIVEEV